MSTTSTAHAGAPWQRRGLFQRQRPGPGNPKRSKGLLILLAALVIIPLLHNLRSDDTKGELSAEEKRKEYERQVEFMKDIGHGKYLPPPESNDFHGTIRNKYTGEEFETWKDEEGTLHFRSKRTGDGWAVSPKDGTYFIPRK